MHYFGIISSQVINRTLILFWCRQRYPYHFEVLRFPIEKLLSEEDHDWVEVAREATAKWELAAALRVDGIEISTDFEDLAEWQLSPFGFHTLRVITSDNGVKSTCASLWPIEKIGIIDPTDTSIYIAPSVVKVIDGQLLYQEVSWSCPVASSESGIYSVVIIIKGENVQLYLLQRDIQPPAIHIRHLDVPCHIVLADVYAIAIEERYGVIYLSLMNGQIFALHYS
ncbi:hypothetical protein C0993_007346 [Termitomyces sp. T159_Od127]|nr:hypothetical protein C0993_007346 [Termitomyces sp. T159_Od127]